MFINAFCLVRITIQLLLLRNLGLTPLLRPADLAQLLVVEVVQRQPDVEDGDARDKLRDTAAAEGRVPC